MTSIAPNAPSYEDLLQLYSELVRVRIDLCARLAAAEDLMAASLAPCKEYDLLDDKYGWLIEFLLGPPTWLSGGDGQAFARDIDGAIRFCRREDAQKMLTLLGRLREYKGTPNTHAFSRVVYDATVSCYSIVEYRARSFVPGPVSEEPPP